LGFIEIYLADSWVFDYFTPDAMRVPDEEQIGKDYAGSPQRTGAVLILTTPGDVRLKLMEIVK
jgi:hypothetical protein